MALQLSQSIAPSQRLEQQITPMQLQGLEVLQAPAMELQHLVNQQLQLNPTLLEVQSAQMVPGDQLQADAPADGPAGREREWDGDLREYDGDLLANVVENIAPFDRRRDASGQAADGAKLSRDEICAHDGRCRDADAEEHRQYLFDSFSTAPPLRIQLENQLDDSALKPPQFARLCHDLCGEVDSRGYLAESDHELAAIFKVPEDQIRRAVKVIQSLYPPGIGARDLRECLLLQLSQMRLTGSLEWDIADRHLEDLARNRIPQIARDIDADIDETTAAIARLKRLNPNPGWSLSFDAAPAVSPDVYVEKDPENGNWTVRMNGDNVPLLALDAFYVRMACAPQTDSATRKYLNENIASASQLIGAIDNRQKTVKRVAAEIVRVQHRWFESGSDRDMRPLTLAMVADKLQLSEGTISRATSNKYLQTPWGLRPFRSFFGGGYRNEQSGESISSLMVRERIKEMVAQEDPAAPLSDQAISDNLKKSGLPVERRTVAKYRDLDGIPSSSMRRQH